MSDNNKLVPVGKAGSTIITIRQAQDDSKPAAQSVSVGEETDGLVDIHFAIDTTGSMEQKILALLRTCQDFVDETARKHLNACFSLISFGDLRWFGSTDTITVVVRPTPKIEAIKNGLAHIPRNNGYGNEGESSFEAVLEVLKLPSRPRTIKIIILITDEPAHQHQHKAGEIISKLRQGEYLVYTVATAHQYYKDMAAQTGGSWTQISSTSNLNHILDIFKDIARKASARAQDIASNYDGSVTKYLALNPPKK